MYVFSHFATKVHLFYLISFECFFFFFFASPPIFLPVCNYFERHLLNYIVTYVCITTIYYKYIYVCVCIVNASVCLQGLRGTSSCLLLFFIRFAMFVLLEYFIGFCDSRISTRTLVVIIIHIHTYTYAFSCICTYITISSF